MEEVEPLKTFGRNLIFWMHLRALEKPGRRSKNLTTVES
jgi:hypothetical protein